MIHFKQVRSELFAFKVVAEERAISNPTGLREVRGMDANRLSPFSL